MFKTFLFSLRKFNKKLLNNHIALGPKFTKSCLFKQQNKHFFGFSQPNPNPDNKKFYEILEVDRNASEEEIKQAYRKKAMKFHPDRGGDPEKFKEITRAYEVLSNKEKKNSYDQFGEEGVQGEAGNPEDIFSHIFGGRKGGRGSQVQRTEDVTYKVRVTLEEIYNGATKPIEIMHNRCCKTCKGKGTTKADGVKKCMGCGGKGMKVVTRNIGPGMVQQFQTHCGDCEGQGSYIKPQDKCGECKGAKVNSERKTLTVDIPKGVKDNKQFIFDGQSDEMPGVKAGDAIVLLEVEKHRNFTRKGADLYYNLKISLLEALTGFETVIPHFNNKSILVKSTPGEIITPGVTKTVQELGMPFFENSYKFGNLNITFTVDFPAKLDSSEKEAYEKLLKTQPKKQVKKDNITNTCHTTPFNPNEANTSERGGKAKVEEQEDESFGQGQQNVKCAQQ
jgi:DnaJ family protein A protein 2